MKRENEDYHYYKRQLDRVLEKHGKDNIYPMTLVIFGSEGKTHHMSINQDSVNALLDTLSQLGYNVSIRGTK